MRWDERPANRCQYRPPGACHQRVIRTGKHDLPDQGRPGWCEAPEVPGCSVAWCLDVGQRQGVSYSARATRGDERLEVKEMGHVRNVEAQMLCGTKASLRTATATDLRPNKGATGWPARRRSSCQTILDSDMCVFVIKATFS